MKRYAHIWRWLAFGLLVLLVALFQSTPGALPRPFGAAMLPAIPLTVAIAMFSGPVSGALVGMAGGLLWDLYAQTLFGFHALLLLLIGCAAGLLIKLLLRCNWLTGWILMACAVLFHTLLEWLFIDVLYRGGESVRILLWSVLPGAAYTILFAPLLYLLVAWIWRRTEAESVA